MIFVTVGTHEQPFNRLIKAIDKMVENKQITEKVIIQKGYSDYNPKYCETYELIGYEDMQKYYNEAHIIITHGGPASFISALAIGKIPIVVPRKKYYNEHVNNHQLVFAKEVEKRMKNIIVADTVEELEKCILTYDNKVKQINKDITNNNKAFNEKLKKEIEDII